MDHIQFKANQTASRLRSQRSRREHPGSLRAPHDGLLRVRRGTSKSGVPIKLEMPKQRAEVRTLAPRRKLAAFSDWRMAASLVGRRSHRRNRWLAGKIHNGHGPRFDTHGGIQPPFRCLAVQTIAPLCD